MYFFSDSDHDSSETSGIRGNIIDIDSILESDGESDTEPNDLGDLGLLTELINDELDEKMKKKILSREYVDFNKLYYGTKDNDVQMVRMKRSKANSVTSVTKKPQKKINNILSWSRAFQLYASIYTSKYTEEAAGMFQYMTLIQTLAKKTPNWQLYDIKFRKLRRYRTLPWSRLHVQTHLYASLATPSKPTFQNNATPFRANSNNFRPSVQNQNQGRIFKKGYCWEFQRTGKCVQRTTVLGHTNAPSATDPMPELSAHEPPKPVMPAQVLLDKCQQFALPTPLRNNVLKNYEGCPESFRTVSVS